MGGLLRIKSRAIIIMNILRKLGAACMGGALFAIPPELAAQTQDPEPDRFHGEDHIHSEIEEVIVRATPMDRNLVEMSQSATVLKDTELAREVANNIGDTLTRLPGLSNASFGQNVGRPVIRGLQGQRVGVLSNNMSAGDASAVSQDHAVSIEPFLADQVEVLRGPSTLLYGSGAIGGVVNIVTHTIPPELPDEPVSGRAMAQIDSAAGQRFAAGRLDLAKSSFAFHANAFYRRTDDYEIPGAAELYPDEDDAALHGSTDEEHDDPSGVLENSFLDNEGGTLGASWIGDRWYGGLAWTTYDSNYGIPGASHHHDEEHGEEAEDDAEEAEEFVTIQLDSSRWDGELTGRQPFPGFEQLKLKVAGIDYTHTEFEGEEIGTVFDSETSEARLELRHKAWGRWDGAFGFQYRDLDFAAVGEEAFVPDSNTRAAAVFWLESTEIGEWQLDIGIRYDDYEIRSTEPEAIPHEGPGEFGLAAAMHGRRTFNPFSASVGAVWHLDDANHLSFNLARAERAPTAQELFALGPHIASQTFEVGNPGLTVEANTHLEAAWRLHGGSRLTASIVVYYDDFDDFIYQENIGEEEDGLPVRAWSQQDARFYGGEIELRYDIGRSSSGHWQAYGFFDTVKGELKQGGNVPLMPPRRIGLGLDWDRQNWAATAVWIHAWEQDRVADYETPTPGYDLLNAELSWLLPVTQKSEWELFLKGQNLLDEDIRNSTSYLKDQAPQIGRNFILGLRALF